MLGPLCCDPGVPGVLCWVANLLAAPRQVDWNFVVANGGLSGQVGLL